jgi:hypothetical protein
VPSSLGIRSLDVPCSRLDSLRLLPPAVASRFWQAELPLDLSRSVLVVSHHLNGFLRVRGVPERPEGQSSSPLRVSGLIACQYRTGSAVFLRSLLPHLARPSKRAGLLSQTTPFPTAQFTPLEEVRSPTAVPRHRGRCPLVVKPPSAPVPFPVVHSDDPQLRGLTPSGNPSRDLAFCSSTARSPSMGFVSPPRFWCPCLRVAVGVSTVGCRWLKPCSE